MKVLSGQGYKETCAGGRWSHGYGTYDVKKVQSDLSG